MPINIRDTFNFLFHNGKGIKADQVEIETKDGTGDSLQDLIDSGDFGSGTAGAARPRPWRAP